MTTWKNPRKEKNGGAINEDEKNKKLVQKKAKEIIQKHKRYIGEDVAESAIEKIEKGKDTQAKTEKEDLENGNVQEKGKRGRPRRKA